MDSQGRDEDDHILLRAPRPTRRQRWTPVLSSTFGRPFGRGAGFGPSLSIGAILSPHVGQNPKGFLGQARYGPGGHFGVGIGYGQGFGYDAYADSKQKYSVIPGFGPAGAIGAKAEFLSIKGRDGKRSWWVGPAGLVVAFKVKVAVGYFLRLDAEERGRLIWELGFGY